MESLAEETDGLRRQAGTAINGENWRLALTCFERLAALEPEEPSHLFNLGLMHNRLHQPRQALELFGRVLKLRPQWPRIYEQLGTTLLELEEHDTAEQVFSIGLQQDPQNRDLCFRLTLLLEGKNQLTEAREVIEQGLKRHPADAALNFAAAKVDQRCGQRQAAMGRLERVIGNAEQPDLVMAAHYEMGQLYDRLNRSREAFHHFQEANRLARRQSDALGLDPRSYLDRLERMRVFLSSLTPEAVPEPPPDRERTPAFLVGFPRSGTSLLGQILDSHPGVRILEEQPVLEAIEERLGQGDTPYPEVLRHIDDAALTRLRAHYFEMADHHAPRQPGQMLLDKMPLNLRNLALVARLFPGAPVLLALRHPCDVVLSAFMQGFGPNESMIHCHTLEGTVRLYARVMELWRLGRGRLPLRVHVVRYEEVVADLEGQARAAVAFLGLPWDEAVLRYREALTRGKIMTTPSYRQVAEPIYQRAVQRWRRYETHLAPHLRALKPALTDLGYP